MSKQQKQLALHIAPTPFFADRGCHIRIEGIVRCLQQNGWDSLVCTYHHGHDVATVKTARISPIKAYTQTTAGPNPWKLWADIKLLWLALKQTKRQRPNVIHAHLHEGLFIALLVKWLLFWRRIPVIADLQGSFTGELDSHGVFKKVPFLKPVSRLCERILMWFPNHIVCSSERSLSLFVEQFSISESRISLAQDGADEAAKLSLEQRVKLRKQYGLPEHKSLIVYSGALLPAKGLAELQALILESQANNCDVHFLIIGYPTTNLEEFLTQNSLASSCSLLGQVPFEQLQPLLGSADIAVDPKNFDAGEGSGKMLNYIACGLPVLAFDTQNNRSFLPPTSPLAATVSDLVEQLKTWSKDTKARSHVGQNNLDYFKSRYSWKVTQAQLSNAYNNLK